MIIQLHSTKVLGIYSYQPLVGKKPQELADTEERGGKTEEESKEADNREGNAVDEQETSDTKSMSMEETVLQGIGSETQEMLKVRSCLSFSRCLFNVLFFVLKMMQEAFQCDLSILRAMYDAAGGELNEFMTLSER